MSDRWSGERLAVAVLGVLAAAAGGSALATLVVVDHPGWRWILAHQHPWPVVTVGVLWMTLGIAAVVVSRRVVAASVLVLAASGIAASILGLEIDVSNTAYAFSDLRWWYRRSPTTLVPLVGSSFVLAAGAAMLIGRVRRRERTGAWPVVAAVVSWLLAAIAAALAAITGGLAMSMETELMSTHVACVRIGVVLWALAGWATGRLVGRGSSSRGA